MEELRQRLWAPKKFSLRKLPHFRLLRLLRGALLSATTNSVATKQGLKNSHRSSYHKLKRSFPVIIQASYQRTLAEGPRAAQGGMRTATLPPVSCLRDPSAAAASRITPDGSISQKAARNTRAAWITLTGGLLRNRWSGLAEDLSLNGIKPCFSRLSGR